MKCISGSWTTWCRTCFLHPFWDFLLSFQILILVSYQQLFLTRHTPFIFYPIRFLLFPLTSNPRRHRSHLLVFPAMPWIKKWEDYGWRDAQWIVWYPLTKNFTEYGIFFGQQNFKNDLSVFTFEHKYIGLSLPSKKWLWLNSGSAFIKVEVKRKNWFHDMTFSFLLVTHSVCSIFHTYLMVRGLNWEL